MLGYYNYTVYLTYAGLVSAVIGMFLANSGNISGAVICLLVSGLCDMFDGKIARTKKDRTAEEKRFGIQIDSLCDLVCFGVLPAMIGCGMGQRSWWQIAIAAFFVLCGVIRLAYFNVTEEIRQESTSEKRKTYAGLPITSSAMLVPLLMCFKSFIGDFMPIAYSILLLITGVCFISPLNIKKPGKTGTVCILVAGLAVLVVYVIL